MVIKYFICLVELHFSPSVSTPLVLFFFSAVTWIVKGLLAIFCVYMKIAPQIDVILFEHKTPVVSFGSIMLLIVDLFQLPNI
jgi:hypothetical protein